MSSFPLPLPATSFPLPAPIFTAGSWQLAAGSWELEADFACRMQTTYYIRRVLYRVLVEFPAETGRHLSSFQPLCMQNRDCFLASS